MNSRWWTAGLLMVALPALAKSTPKKFLDRVAYHFQFTDVHLQPPVGQPSPKAGSFITPYQVPEGEEPDPAKYGTHTHSVGECTGHLTFREVDAAEARTSFLRIESGLAAKLGIPGSGLSIGGAAGRVALAGVEWNLTKKTILNGGEEEMVRCCLETGQCKDEFISEWWMGTGKIYATRTDKKSLKLFYKLLGAPVNGSLGLEDERIFSQSSSWDKPMYFAYRTTKLELPTCEDYLERHPPGDEWVSFTGVSKFLDNEQEAEEDAWNVVRKQLTESLGARYDAESDTAEVIVGDILGLFEDFSCRDIVDGPRPQYQVRTRIKTEKSRFDAKLDEISGIDRKGAE